MENIYQEIVGKIERMIPEKWSSVYLYAEKWADYDTVYFYSYPKDKHKAHLHYEITERIQVDSTGFDHLEDELRDTIILLYEKQMSQEELGRLDSLLHAGEDEYRGHRKKGKSLY